MFILKYAVDKIGEQSTYIAAVLTCTYNICFEQKYENSQKISTENCHLYSSENLLFIAWACFRYESSQYVL